MKKVEVHTINYLRMFINPCQINQFARQTVSVRPEERRESASRRMRGNFLSETGLSLAE